MCVFFFSFLFFFTYRFFPLFVSHEHPVHEPAVLFDWLTPSTVMIKYTFASIALYLTLSLHQQQQPSRLSRVSCYWQRKA